MSATNGNDKALPIPPTQSKGDWGDPDIQARLIADYESLQVQQTADGGAQAV